MNFRNHNPLIADSLGGLYRPGEAGYVKTLAPTTAAYYPIEKAIARETAVLRGIPSEESMMDSPLAKFLCGVAIFAGGYLLCKAMYEPPPVRVMNPGKKKRKRRKKRESWLESRRR